MSSVREIARLTGVSITTVSRVLNNHPNVRPNVRDMVLAAANRSRYVATVGRRSTNNIAFVYTGERSLGSPYDAALLAGLGDALEETEYDLLIIETRRSRRADETYSSMFMRKGVRGAVLRVSSASRGVAEAIAAEGFPVVVVGERFENAPIPCIYTDSRTTSREAVEYLIELGHRRIAISANVVDDSDHVDRLTGYREGLARFNVPFDDRLVWRLPANRAGGPQVIKRFLAMGDAPTAVYITDPLTCIGALAEARRAGVRVPEQLSIVGFDDGDLRYAVFPTLTAVCQDATAVGRQSYQMLESLLTPNTSQTCDSRVLKSWFELHDSTGPCPRTEPNTV